MLPIATKIVFSHKRFFASTMVLIFLCSLTGCEKRKLLEPTRAMDADGRSKIKVLLFDNITSCTISGCAAFSVIGVSPHTQADFNKSKQTFDVKIRDGKIIVGAHQFAAELTIQPAEPVALTFNDQTYRGNFKIIAQPDNRSFDVINILPVEAYLAGVIGAEMPAYWEPEALKAQAIAARTYCLYIKNRFGSQRNWDVGRTQAHQVYRGVAAESPTIWDAVNATERKVLLCADKSNTRRIFPTYYSSTCGGHTENSKNVFGDSYSTLAGTSCPYCKAVAKRKFLRWSDVEFTTDEITKKLAKCYPKLKSLGKIKSIEPAKTSNYEKFDRITSVKITGQNGKSEFLRAEDLRLAIDHTGRRIKSTACQILKAGDKFRFVNGTGFGHAVGMCQCGAQAMARTGATSRDILNFYYPGSIVRVY